MPDPDPNRSSEDAFSRSVGAQEKRKLKASRKGAHVWSGLGMVGMIGWSVGVPTLLGILLGRWLDGRQGETRSWTLSLLVAGLCVGCANAWHWITNEQKAIHDEKDDE